METFDTPVDRARAVAFALICDPSGPNILLGILVSAILQFAIGMVPWTWPTVAAVAWLAAVVAYSIADEVREAIEDEKTRLLDPVATRPRGIE